MEKTTRSKTENYITLEDAKPPKKNNNKYFVERKHQKTTMRQNTSRHSLVTIMRGTRSKSSKWPLLIPNLVHNEM